MKIVKNVRNGLRTEISGSGYLESARNFDPNPMAMVPDPKIRIFGSKNYILTPDRPPLAEIMFQLGRENAPSGAGGWFNSEADGGLQPSRR